MEATEFMKCDWCGKEFPADARACVEAGVDAEVEGGPEEGEEWKGEAAAPQDLTPEQRARVKAEMGIDDAQLDELLASGTVGGLGAIVCLACQDAAAAAQ